VAVVKICNLESDSQLHTFIVARDDGSVEIYSFDYKSPIPILRFETKISESITGIDTGYISNPNKQEVLISTYSGKIMSLVEKSGVKSTQMAVPVTQIKQSTDVKITKTELETQIENDIKKL
jgi:hypothetical protein